MKDSRRLELENEALKKEIRDLKKKLAAAPKEAAEEAPPKKPRSKAK